MEERMNRIVHISLKVDDVKRTGDFYQEVFGFRDSETRKTRDHLSRHMTDGVIDFTLMKYDAARSRRSRRAPATAPASTISPSRSTTSRARPSRSANGAARS
jgi:catechol 2,3-dioxygenase-like lactoylglutathione lyase family enzyme